MAERMTSDQKEKLYKGRSERRHESLLHAEIEKLETDEEKLAFMEDEEESFVKHMFKLVVNCVRLRI